ncbi:MAG: PAS domain-containing protein, partial [Pyrinomonadaceae bacterium]
MTGFTREESLSRNLRQAIAPEYHNKAKAMIAAKLAGEEKTAYELEIIAKDGHRIAVEVNTRIIYENGIPVGVQGIARDVTWRKLADVALRESDKKFHQLADNISDVFWIRSPDMSKVYYISPAYEQIWGRKLKTDHSDPHEWQDFIVPEDRQHVKEAYAGLMRDESEIEVEFRILRPDGEQRWVRARGFQVKDASGEVIRLAGIVTDITDKKRAEALLVESQEQLALAAESVNFGIWDWNIVEDKVVWDSRMIELYGIPADEFTGGFEAWQKGVHPDDQQPRKEKLDAALAGLGPFTNEFRVVWPNGEVHHLEGRALVERDSDGKPVRMIGVNWDITDRKIGEKALAAAEENYRSIFENAVEGIFQSTNDGRFISANPAMARILGFDSPEELIALRTDIRTQHYVDPACRIELSSILENEGVAVAYECEVYKKDGTKIWTQENIRAIRDADGVFSHYEGSIEDITARRSLEDQFRQSQKMEAVGVMAGGIAHDFNNLLTAINGYSDLTLRKMKADDPLRPNIEQVKDAGSRAAELTSQLLAFSRKQVLKPVVHNLNSVIETIEKMLRRIIRENVELRTVLDADLGNIKADPGQVEQVIINLAVNARDAMPDGGTLKIETENVYLDNEYVSQKLAIEPGPFVRMTVTDTGVGIDATTQQHIFEPFFTTKEVGKGTGLGLSTVYGIVKQSGGDIMVYSEPGHGTTFNIYLPRVDGGVERPKWHDNTNEPPRGTETILLVEDEEVVRRLVYDILTGNGYTVLEAANGKAALEICSSYDGHIDMMLTDVIMPNMSGVELKQAVVAILPEIKVMFMSGYTYDAIADRGELDVDKAFIEKPFTPDALSRKV